MGSAIADAVAPKPLDPIEADQRELPLKFDFQSIWGGGSFKRGPRTRPYKRALATMAQLQF